MAKIIRVISTILSSKIRRQIIPVYIITTTHSALASAIFVPSFYKTENWQPPSHPDKIFEKSIKHTQYETHNCLETLIFLHITCVAPFFIDLYAHTVRDLANSAITNLRLNSIFCYSHFCYSHIWWYYFQQWNNKEWILRFGTVVSTSNQPHYRAEGIHNIIDPPSMAVH